jgi:hypothetical protein
MLRDHGYDTGAFVANFSYLYRDYGLARGFGTYDDAPGLLLTVRPPMVRVAQLVWPSFGRKPFRTAPAMNAAALAWLDARPAGRPAFLFVNYMEPHQPWVAEPPYTAGRRPAARRNAGAQEPVHPCGPAADADTMRFISAHYDGQWPRWTPRWGAARRAPPRGRYENAP